MKRIFEKIKQNAKVFQKGKEKAQNRYFRTDVFQKLLGYRKKAESKEQLKEQNFKNEQKPKKEQNSTSATDQEQQTASDSNINLKKLIDLANIESFTNYAKEKIPQKIKDGVKWVEEANVKDSLLKSKDDLAGYAQKILNDSKSFGTDKLGAGKEKLEGLGGFASSNFKKAADKLSIKRKIKWAVGLVVTLIFFYGLGNGLPRAYLNYKLESQKIELEREKLRLKELRETRSKFQ